MPFARRALRRLGPVAIAFVAILSGPAQIAQAFTGLPNLPVNACNNSALPKSFGTNFPVPADPMGFGFFDQSILGWERNVYAPVTYLSGSFFARGVPTTFAQGGTTFCGAMYSFSVYTFGLASGQAPAPGSVQWTMEGGYLPALTTSFSRGGLSVSIKNLADQVAIGGGSFELVYTRVSLTNNGFQRGDRRSRRLGPEPRRAGQPVEHPAARAVVEGCGSSRGTGGGARWADVGVGRAWRYEMLTREPGRGSGG
jgi:hypothetical protein